MNSGYNGRRRGGLMRSFGFAIEGIFHSLIRERNLKIHLTVALSVTVLGFLYEISSFEWLVIVLAIGGMLSFELMNTAVERVVDLITEEYHPLAKQAKDIAAGAVLIYALISVLIGCIIFLPKMF
ncbi:diacylglycerol kinase family protein [Bacillus tuaregi]|uniref:diacylglycerol kinase family protein n=1 Tax=Bacillus tuaregi TaxID=1816695 RepID=UPI0008F88487|nr:diacylglycerol kinase family protein [Bacillus tuaregi]